MMISGKIIIRNSWFFDNLAPKACVCDYSFPNAVQMFYSGILFSVLVPACCSILGCSSW